MPTSLKKILHIPTATYLLDYRGREISINPDTVDLDRVATSSRYYWKDGKVHVLFLQQNKREGSGSLEDILHHLCLSD